MGRSFDTPVLIIGGGPVGLGCALDLGWRGTRSIVVERDPSTAPVMLAKANGLHERTMETCRRWGLVDQVADRGFPSDLAGDSVYCTSLTGHFLSRTVIPSTDDRPLPPETPEKRRRCPQYEFDPILADEAKRLGFTEFRYSTEFLGLEQDDEGVTAQLRNLLTDETYTIRAQYLVACDGAGSLVRRGLGVSFDGRMLDFSMSAMMRIPDLPAYHPIEDGERYILIGPEGVWASMVLMDGSEIWRFSIVGSQEKLKPDAYDILPDIHRALGRDDVEFEIIRVVPWRRSQCVAGTYRVGRVLLAGDSAHTTSPTGGHGMNTGLADAMDVSWMLDAILRGWGGESLLDAYDLERRPVGLRNSAHAARNYGKWIESSGYARILDEGPEGDACRDVVGKHLVASLHDEWHSLGVDLGYRYEGSPAIIADGTAPPDDEASVYIQTARPGHRAPHAWLADGRSTLDLFGRGFVLLRFRNRGAEVGPLVEAAGAVGMPLEVIDIAEPGIADLYERTLVLIRPDGHVAWRADRLPDDVIQLIDTVRGAGRVSKAELATAAG